MGQVIRLYEDNPNEKGLREAAEMLRHDAVAIFPTDSFYAFGCSLESHKAINRIKLLKRKSDDNLSLICSDLSNIADYARVDNHVFKLLKRNTPGAFTFILNASNRVPNAFLNRKKSVGIRVPGNRIATGLVKELGAPLVVTSIPLGDIAPEDCADPSLLWDVYKEQVDLLIDGGLVPNVPTTVADLSSGEAEIIRQSEAELAL